MADNSMMKLGKRAPRIDHRTLRMARYLMATLPGPPPSVDYSKGITSFGMMCNDKLGDCTIAAVGHAVQVWTANASQEATVSDDEVLQYYEQWDGYDPKDPSTDQGGVEIDVLNNWRQNGFSGHTLNAYVAVDLGNQTEVQQAIWLFGGIYIGVQLPVTAQNQDVWDVVSDMTDPDAQPGSWGGHAIYVPQYDFTPNQSPDTLSCITWGKLQKMTWAWFREYCDECYALVSKDWIEASGVAPSGLDLAQLQADLAVVTA